MPRFSALLPIYLFLLAMSGCTAHTEKPVWYLKNATPESLAAQLKIGMTRGAVEQLIAQVRLGDEFYWRNRGWGMTNESYTVGDGVYLWLSYSSMHWSLNDKLTAIEIGHLDDLQPNISPELFVVIHLINNSPVPNNSAGLHFNPLGLIRCVNGLHALGKEKALRVLHEYSQYARLAEDSAGATDAPDISDFVGKYDLDDQRVFLIARLLFVRADGNPIMPEMSWMIVGYSHELPWDNDYPLHPLIVVDDVPLNISDGAVGEGIRSPIMDLDYCEKNCLLRKTRLSPSASPIDAANTLIHSASWKHTFEHRPPEDEIGAMDFVRIGALRCVEELINGENFIGSNDKKDTKYLSDATWLKYSRDQCLQNLKWNPAKQAFYQARK